MIRYRDGMLQGRGFHGEPTLLLLWEPVPHFFRRTLPLAPWCLVGGLVVGLVKYALVDRRSFYFVGRQAEAANARDTLRTWLRLAT
ncbi:MAG: hypothetical protein ACP5VE_10185 [Chthonomonadales bacterium]